MFKGVIDMSYRRHDVGHGRVELTTKLKIIAKGFNQLMLMFKQRVFQWQQ